MRSLFVTIFITIYVVCKTQASLKENEIADLEQNFLNSTYDFFVPLYKAVGRHTNVNFAFAPRSVWITLAAIAEGSSKEVQQRLFEILSLPNDPFYRQKYYQLMTSSIVPFNDISLVETRSLLVHESVNMNPDWMNLVSDNSLLNVANKPIQYDPVFTANWMKKYKMDEELPTDLSGNSMLVNTIDFDGLWATAFDNAIIESSPFYNQEGEEIGTVDLMRIKHRAKLGHCKSINAKILELPVGPNRRYRMLFISLLDKKDNKMAITNMNKNIVFEMLSSLKDTIDPIDIAIPRFKITSEINMRAIIEDLGVTDLWRDPKATKHISSPPAFPTTFVQRVTATINKYGPAPPSIDQNQLLANPKSTSEQKMDFIANQPLLIGIFEAETYTPLLGVGLSQPTSPKYGRTYVRNI